MFNSIQFVEGLKENELKTLEKSRRPHDSAFAFCSTFESLVWFVEGVRLGYFDSRNAREVIRFYYEPFLSRLKGVRSKESDKLAKVLREQGLDLTETKFTVQYNLILAYLPAFGPFLTRILNKPDPFLDVRIHDDMASMLAFESLYTPASLFTSDFELQQFTKLLNFANEPEWDRYVKSSKPEHIAVCVIDVLEYTMNQKQTIADTNLARFNLDVFVRQAQAWRMACRSQFSAKRFSRLAGLLDKNFVFKHESGDLSTFSTILDFGSFDEAVRTIQGFWRLEVGAAA